MNYRKSTKEATLDYTELHRITGLKWVNYLVPRVRLTTVGCKDYIVGYTRLLYIGHTHQSTCHVVMPSNTRLHWVTQG